MATEKPYTILVKGLPEPHDDYKEQQTWREFDPISATSPEKAIEALWEAYPEMKVDTSLLYFPVANFKPKRQRRSFIERWTLDDAELPDEEQPGQRELPT